MDQKTKNTLLIVLTLIVVFCGLLSYKFNIGNDIISVPKEFHDISTIKIIYEFHDWGEIHKRDYLIELKGERYFCQEKRIDDALIHGLVNNFTDFYESEGEKSQALEVILDFEVIITLKNGKNVILSTTEWSGCFVPWNIEYKGDTYVQYNGKIPSALLKILAEIDRELWSKYSKEIEWGCAPAAVPAHYLEKEISRNFPQSRPSFTPLETQGKAHILWETTVTDSIGPPICIEEKVIVLTKRKVAGFNALTGECMWETKLKILPGEKHIQGELVGYEGRIYAAVPPCTVYSLDSNTGDIQWRTTLDTRDNTHLRIAQVRDKLVVYELWGEGLACLDRKTGQKVWVTHDTVKGVQISEDGVFVKAYDWKYQRFYYAVIEIESGAVIWETPQKNIVHPIYENGILYYSREEGEFVALTIRDQREQWSYTYGVKAPEYTEGPGFEFLRGQKVYEEGVLLLVPTWRKSQSAVKMVILDKNGSSVGQYYFPEKSVVEHLSLTAIEIVDSTVYFLARDGFLEAFNIENGERTWLSEVRGPHIRSFQILCQHLYLTDSGSLYCLDLDTGQIVWHFNAAKESSIAVPVTSIFCSQISDGFIFVATSQKLYALLL